MTISETFTPRTPNPDKALPPPAHDQLPSDQHGKPILLPITPKATFQLVARLSLAVHGDYQK